MRKASIDIGTNSVLLLVADVDGTNLNVLKELQEVPRLGKGVDKNRNLHHDSQQRVITVLKKYQNYLSKHYPETTAETIVTATSAARDAANRDQFLDSVNSKTGWDVKLLSGREEAEITYRGALSVLNGREKTNNVVLDIGGGSTEIAYGSGYNLADGFSADMGSVRFTERFLSESLPADSSQKNLREAVQELLHQRSIPYNQFDVIGVAGTVTSIAAIYKNLADYEADKLNGIHLSRDVIREFIKEFTALSADEIERKHSMFLKGRGDVILTGLLILDEFLLWAGREEIVVSTGGIRHGVLV